MINKKLINTGAAAEAAFLPSQHFDTVTYTGNGGTQRIGGYINRGAVFNGSSSRIDLPSLGGLSPSSDFTISCWVNAGNQANGDNTIVTIWDNINVELRIDGSSSNTVRVVYHNGTSFGFFNSSFTLTENQWTHLTVTYEVGTGFTFYKNSTSSQLYSFTSTIATTAGTNKIGQYSGDTVNGYFNGKIDQVRIFNRNLTSSEVTTLYGETAASTSKSVTDIFNDDSGIALYQLDGNANDTGGVSGKFGSAAIFNGSSSYIDTNYSLPASSNFSFSFWFTLDVSGTKFLAGQTGDSSNYFHIASANATLLEIQIGSVNYVQLSVPNMADGNWHHLVISRSAGSGYTAYLDNSSVGTFSNTAALSSANFFLGARDASHSSSLRHLGKIDQVRIYSSALSSSDVTNLYNETSVPTANLVAHYKFDGDARDEQQQYDGAATNVIYAYDGTPTNVTYQKATDFQPDFVWIKKRSGTAALTGHVLHDSVRGATYSLYSDLTNAQGNTNAISSFDSNGFTIGTSYDGTNGSGNNIVAWCWKAGGAAVSNTNGTITSQVSANQAAGFSIVKQTSNNTNQTYGHGLSQAPEMIISKNIDVSGPWGVYHKDLGTGKWLYFNTTDSVGTSVNVYPTVNDTVFSGGSQGWNYLTSNYINYCFHSVEGYSKIGSYTGNGSASGPIVETGFQPAFVMVKNASSGDNWHRWYMFDNERDTVNPNTLNLAANTSDAEIVNTDAFVDFLENGFQIKTGASPLAVNQNGNTFIYMAFAADPDVTQPVVENSFDVVTYTGTGTTQTINTDFKPDLVWIKSRSNATSHELNDSVRGQVSRLFTDSTSAASTVANGFVSLDSNGFSLDGTGGGGEVNVLSRTYVAWCWKAGDHDDNLPQINTNGTIDSIVSVNAAAGFSIVKWYNASGTNQRIGHGLSSAPELIIYKATDSATNWYVGTTAIDGSMDILTLNTTAAKTDDSATYLPTSTTITNFNFTGNWISYCFHSVSGYQKVGSYSGGSTGSGAEISVGFEPRFVMIKKIDSYLGNANWWMWDNKRNPSSPYGLLPNLSVAEQTNDLIRFTSTGFYFVSTNGEINNSGSTFIYLAIA